MLQKRTQTYSIISIIFIVGTSHVTFCDLLCHVCKSENN